MRPPDTASPGDIESLPDRPAVFLLWAEEGKPYLARTAALRRRLKRLLTERDRLSRVLNLSGVVERIDYWLTGSQMEAALIHLELAQKHFPEDWPRITRLRPPAFLRLTVDNAFPRTMITTRLGRGVYYGPFASRAAAETFQTGLLDLFQLRRCEENLNPSPEHPGCIYGEMNRCLRPCQQIVSLEEYAGEATRVRQFLETGGQSLKERAEQARDRASAEMQFEEAERLHQRVERIAAVQASNGELAACLDQLSGIAVVPSAVDDTVDLWFLIAARWQSSHRLALSEGDGAGKSLDRRIRELVQAVASQSQPETGPNLEHLSVLTRWHSSSWRDGEWIPMQRPSAIPYRKLVNAVGRVAGARAQKADRIN